MTTPTRQLPPEERLRTAVCQQCTGEFVFYPNRGSRRRICPRCAEENERQAKKRWKLKASADGSGRHDHDRSVAQMTLAEIAQALGVDVSTVRQAELSALKRIRSSPELMELWASVKESGFPVAQMPRRDPGESLLDYQLRVADWWQTHDRIAALGLTTEAQQCLKEISAFQRVIARELEKAK